MKKIVMSLALLSSIVLADGWYMGANALFGKEKFTFKGNSDIEASTSANGFRLILGNGIRGDWAVEGALTFTSHDKEIYTTDDGSNVTFELNSVKSFNLDNDFYPYIKLGLMYGSMKIAEGVYDVDHVNSLGVQLGVGLDYAINENVDLELGVDIAPKVWSSVIIGSTTVDVSSVATQPYLGIKYRF